MHISLAQQPPLKQVGADPSGRCRTEKMPARMNARGFARPRIKLGASMVNSPAKRGNIRKQVAIRSRHVLVTSADAPKN